MPIEVKCAECDRRFKVPDTAIGKSGKCPVCGSKIAISPPEIPEIGFTTKPFVKASEADPKRILWVAGTAIFVVLSATGFSILFKDDVESRAVKSEIDAPTESKPDAAKPSTTQSSKPFEYKVLSEEWQDSVLGRVALIELQVADDIAPSLTEADLKSLAALFVQKYNSGYFKVLLFTETPLVQAWGVIIHDPNRNDGDTLECSIHKHAFEFGPWYFPERIDQKAKWHQLVWLTLPIVNKIVNGATQFDWEVTDRSANEVYFDSKQTPYGAIKDQMRLSPQTWEISTRDGDVPRFVRLVESSLNHFESDFAQKIIGNLNSVIGSQEYLNSEKANWTWMIDRLEVTYFHFDRSDTVTIMKTKP